MSLITGLGRTSWFLAHWALAIATAARCLRLGPGSTPLTTARISFSVRSREPFRGGETLRCFLGTCMTWLYKRSPRGRMYLGG
jgi:hypothetical protein